MTCTCHYPGENYEYCPEHAPKTNSHVAIPYSPPARKACPWGRCNGTGYSGGTCNRCGTPVDFPYVKVSQL